MAVGALAATLGGTPGALDVYDDSPVVAAACVLGVAGAVAAAWLPTATRLAFGVLGGGAGAHLVGGDEVPWALIVVGAALGAACAWAVGRLLEGALKADGTRGGLAAISGAAGIGAAVLALIPFVGYALVVALAWLLYRTRRREQGQYAGLRVLK